MKKRFLIVDDHYMIRDFIKDLFQYFELSCDEAKNGREAVEKWEHEDYLAILMDIEMPVMDGLQAAHIIRTREKQEKRSHTPIYAVSGTTSFNNPKEICRMAGMDGFIAKPVTINQLLEVAMPLVHDDKKSLSRPTFLA